MRASLLTDKRSMTMFQESEASSLAGVARNTTEGPHICVVLRSCP